MWQNIYDLDLRLTNRLRIDAQKPRASQLNVMSIMKKRAKKIYQGFAILISLTVIATGVAPILTHGGIFYFNWKGAAVFSPIAILVGLLLLYLVVFKWDKMLKMK